MSQYHNTHVNSLCLSLIAAMPLKYSNKLNGKRVVVVGGTSGIGFAAAEAAVEYGAIVVVASSQQSKVDNTVEKIRMSYPDVGDRIRGKVLDLSAEDVEDQITSLFDFATDGGKYKLDHLIQTAGDLFEMTPLAEATHEKFTDAFRVRVTGSLLLAKIGLKYINPSPLSSFTLTSGILDTKPRPGLAVMAPVGAALKGLTHALAVDMKPIRVNCVCPGAVKTERFDRFSNPEEVMEMFRSMTLSQVLGTPEDLAECYLCSMNNPFMTGVEIYADGGYLLV